MDLSKRIPRRSVLAKSALGLAAVGAAVGMPALVFPDELGIRGSGTRPSASASGLAGPLVAYVHDAAKGEVVVMVGINEVVVRDPQLVSRLMGAFEV